MRAYNFKHNTTIVMDQDSGCCVTCLSNVDSKIAERVSSGKLTARDLKILSASLPLFEAAMKKYGGRLHGFLNYDKDCSPIPTFNADDYESIDDIELPSYLA